MQRAARAVTVFFSSPRAAPSIYRFKRGFSRLVLEFQDINLVNFKPKEVVFRVIANHDVYRDGNLLTPENKNLDQNRHLNNGSYIKHKPSTHLMVHLFGSGSCRDVSAVCIETNGTVCGPTNLRCRKLFSTFPSSNLDKPQKSLKRIPKDKRRAMVEAFVERYKVDNAGKFPSAKYTTQQVGGSYYVIREILQMLKYEPKVSSEKETQESAQEKLKQHNESDFNVNEAHLKSCITRSSTPLENPSDVKAGSVANKMEMNESLLVKVSGASIEPSVSPHLVSLHGDQDPVRYETTSMGGTMPLSKRCSQDLDACTSSKPDSKASEEDDSKELQQDGQETPEQEPSRRVVSGELRDEEPRKTTVWSNLKSLADNIINFWRT